MIKEELEKRAFAEADKVVIGKGMNKRAVVHLRHLLKSMYVDGAISETELLSQQITDLEDKLANADYQLEGRDNEIKELEAQIEKMKCCQNCRKFNNLSYDCTCAEVCNEWELRR